MLFTFATADNHAVTWFATFHFSREPAMADGKKVRDAKTGEYVKSDQAKKRPATTVSETDKKKKK